MLDAALVYAARGWPVLACRPGGKAPLAAVCPRGVHGATTDADTLRRWWAKHPNANVAIACGPGGVAVVDVDPQNDGHVQLEHLLDQHTELPMTVTAQTPRGGLHWYFDHPTTEVRSGALRFPNGKVVEGVDFQAAGRFYCLAAPSRITGIEQGYEWMCDQAPGEQAMAPLPQWIVDMMRVDGGIKLTDAVGVADEEAEAIEECVPRGKVDELVSALEALDPSMAYDDWIRVGMAVHDRLPGRLGRSIWDQWSAGSGTKFQPDATWKHWKSFRNATNGVHVETLFAMAIERGWSHKKDVAETLAVLKARMNGAPPAPNNGQQVEEPTPTRRFPVHHPLSIDSTPRTWIIRGRMAKGDMGVLYGPPACGKTVVAVDLTRRVAMGEPWGDGSKVKPGRVLYLIGEGGRRAIQDRFRAADFDGAMSAQQWGRIGIVDELPRLPQDAEAFANDVLEQQPAGYDLVVVDTLSTLIPGMDENSQAEMSALLEASAIVAKQLGNAALLFLHHSAKSVDTRGPRGSSTLLARVDFCWKAQPQPQQTVVHCEKYRHGPQFDPWRMKLIGRQVGVDDDGHPITSVYGVPMGKGELGAPVDPMTEVTAFVHELVSALGRQTTLAKIDQWGTAGNGRNAARRLTQRAAEAGLIQVQKPEKNGQPTIVIVPQSANCGETGGELSARSNGEVLSPSDSKESPQPCGLESG